MPRSAKSSSTSRYESEKRKYQPTARRITSGSNWRHLNRQETDDAKSIGPPYQTTPAKLQHCLLSGVELVHKIIKGQFGLPESFGTDPFHVWYNVLAA